MWQQMKPFFVAIDGVDGTGKSTQTELLIRWLMSKGLAVEKSCEPGGTPTGAKIRSILVSKESRMAPDTELLLFLADRAEHQHKIIKHLEDGKSVVTDRFLPSTWAYQIYGRGLSPELLEAVTSLTVTRFPDLTIILDMDEKTALERAEKRLKAEGKSSSEGRFEAESLAFFAKVREGFRAYAAHERFGRSVLIDSSGSTEDVALRIQRALTGVLGL